MTLQELIAMLENRLRFNQSQRTSAAQRGDIALVASLDADMAETQNTLLQLRELV